jgi:hypothetical protein
VKLWDIQSLQELVTLRGEGSAFSQTRFSPDGNLLGTMNYRGAPIEAALQAQARFTLRREAVSRADAGSVAGNFTNPAF